MFFFLSGIFFAYDWLLFAAAIIPAAYLMNKVYRSDKLEPESRWMLFSLVICGALATVPAWIIESVFSFVQHASLALYCIIIGIAEEGSKYFLMYKRTWRDPEFNCQYDGVVYAVFVSLGFALLENIGYVWYYGLSTAFVRAVTAIPGHACFGVFMGVFYGLAKRMQNYGEPDRSQLYRVLAPAIPALIHAAYDYYAIAGSSWPFLIFIAVLFLISLRLINRMSRSDTYIR